MGKLLIIRGNSGSGKTTIARRLQREMQPRFARDSEIGTMLVQQDVVRRDILRVKELPANPAIELIEQMVLYGDHIGYNVILEGIFAKDIYNDMLFKLINHFKDRISVCYLDISLNETLVRHATKPNAHEFGENEMREWYKAQDMLGVDKEIVFGDSTSEDGMYTELKKFFM